MAELPEIVWDGGKVRTHEFPAAPSQQELEKSYKWKPLLYVVLLRRSSGIISIGRFANGDEKTAYVGGYGANQVDDHEFVIERRGMKQADVLLKVNELTFAVLPKQGGGVFIFRFETEARPQDFVSALFADPKKDKGATVTKKEKRRTQVPLLPPILDHYPEVADQRVLARQFQLKAALARLNSVDSQASGSVQLKPSFKTVCLVGAQGAGKSTLLEYLVGCPCTFKAGGAATRRPVIYHVQQDAELTDVEYYFGEENEPPVALDELLHRIEVGQGDEFQSSPQTVYMKGPKLFTITIVDLPGYPSSELLPTVVDINRPHIAPTDSLIVVVRRAGDWESGDDKDAKAAVESVDPGYKRTVVVTTQMMYLFNQIRQQIPQYLDGKGDGEVFFENARKFFVDVKLEHMKAGPTKPVQIEAAHAEEIISEATERLENALQGEKVDMGIYLKNIGIRRLSSYIRYAVVGTRDEADRWIKDCEDKLKGYVKLRLRDLQFCVVEPADYLTTLHKTVLIYGRQFQQLMSAGPGAGGTTATEEHDAVMAMMPEIVQGDNRPDAKYSLSKDAWPISELHYESKDEKKVGGNTYVRLVTDEMPEMWAQKFSGPKNKFSSEKEIKDYSGLASRVNKAPEADIVAKAVEHRSQKHFTGITRYLLQRAMYCITLGQMDTVIARLPGLQSRIGQNPTPKEMLLMGLLQPDSLWRQLIKDWTCDFISTKLYPEAQIVGHYLSELQFTEFQNHIEELEKTHGNDLVAFANAALEAINARYKDSMNNLLDVYVKRMVIVSSGDNQYIEHLTSMALEFCQKQPELAAKVFEDGNSRFLAQKQALEAILALLDNKI